MIVLADDLAMDAVARKVADGPPTCSFGMNDSSSSLHDAYGGMSSRGGKRLNMAQIKPLLQYFGFGAQEGTPAAAHQQQMLAGGTGPLADFIRQGRDLFPQVYGQSQQIGNRVADQGNQAYGQFSNVLGQSLGQVNQAIGNLQPYQQAAGMGRDLASRYAQRAANPLADEDLYQVAQRRVLSQLRPSLAGRGLEGSTGAGAQAESDALRGLATDFAGQRRADQYNSLGALQNANTSGAQIATAGAPLAAARTQMAGSGMDAVGQFAQLLQQRYGIPMQAMGSILNLLTAGQQPGLALTQATAPQLGTSSSGWRLL